MKQISIIFLFFLALMSVSVPANAKGGGVIGERDNIHKIEDIKLTGNNGESLYLGYMTESYFLIAGVFMKDAGYVIGINGDDDAYYPMPEGEELKQLQAEGLMPKEIPSYKIPLLDYVIGFSLWLILPFILLYMKFSNKDSEPVTEPDTHHPS